jgi:hypothetical protein
MWTLLFRGNVWRRKGGGGLTRVDQNFFERYPGDSLTPMARLTCGGLAGITSVVFTYPLDIVRTRLSVQSASFAELGSKPEKLPGMWTTLGAMYKTEGGVRALYRGMVPTVAGVAPYVRDGTTCIAIGNTANCARNRSG